MVKLFGRILVGFRPESAKAKPVQGHHIFPLHTGNNLWIGVSGCELVKYGLYFRAAMATNLRGM